jgi:FdhD protein
MNEEDASPLPPPSAQLGCVIERGATSRVGSRCVPEETAIAFTFNGSTHAVMMATPDSLEDFAVGFALTEGLIDDPAEIASLAVAPLPLGVEVRMWLSDPRGKAYVERRRTLAGPTGCGLCGIESLEAAMRTAPQVAVDDLRLDARAIAAAMASLAPGQRLNAETHAVHAAGFWTDAKGLIAVREDVGRHNALDKLAGALARSGERAATGLIVMTSRVSIELIQKAARIGAPAIAAISAPTAAAVRLADACGITLIAVARGQDFEIFTHAERLSTSARHVA